MSVTLTKATDTAPTAPRLPVAILTEADILRSAADALQEYERLRAALRDADTALRVLCRQYDKATGIWGAQPHHLRRACEARGLMA